MTALRINIAAFTRACREMRDQNSFDDEMAAATTLTERKDVYRDDCDFDSSMRYSVRPAAVKTREQKIQALRDELEVAAQSAYLAGATQKQIDLIVELSIEQDDFTPLGSGRLTKADASRIIDSMMQR